MAKSKLKSAMAFVGFMVLFIAGVLAITGMIAVVEYYHPGAFPLDNR